MTRSRRAAGARTFLTMACVVLFALTAGCGGAGRSGAGSAERTPGGLVWRPCTSPSDSGFDCATLQVPLDHANPTGRTISLALIRTRATGKHPIGNLLVNPGGPGASAIDSWSFLSGQLSSDLHKHFNIVGFDPRGVGHSTPVRCADAAGLDAYTELDFSPGTPAATAALEAGAKKFADGCVANSGWLLPYISTAQAAQDMDSIRVALGESSLSYLGYSYGTYLGAQYAQEHPTTVRAMVLDGALDPTAPPV
ncbi:MAG TPA: alpha/beta fold hydrolase, partial [Mycobacteriales bacterium]|nr:alpha/beta fold hydrolase [Mycobacteriales bacterium]